MKASFSDPRKASLAVAALFVAAHATSVAPSLEDIDSINFALGLRDFDPARHQPHPPGSPVYIAVGRAVLSVVSAVRPQLSEVTAEAQALGLISLAAAAVGILAVASMLVLAAPGRRWVAGWSAALLAACPLFWLSGLRPMSDLPGLAAALVSQVLILRGGSNPTLLVWGALTSGLAAGVRAQTVWLTLPLLLFVLLQRRPWDFGAAIRTSLALAAGVLVWAVPLVADSGGFAGYVRALGTQAGEDFAWVDMLWLDPTPRRLAIVSFETLVLPWGSVLLAGVVLTAAAAGAVVACLRQPRAALLILTAFGPYTVFHLLFQETLTVRYALPTIVPVVWCAVVGLRAIPRVSTLAAAALVGAALLTSVPAGLSYGSEAHPAFRAIDRLEAERRGAEEPLFSHYSLWRALQARPDVRALEPRRQFEWLGPAAYWMAGGVEPIWFLADPRRTDLALIDPHARQDVWRFRWAVAERPELGGSRPLGADLYRISAPGWFVGEGWSLTPETGGLVTATGSGPDVRPIEAWIRRSPGAFHLMVGGRHLGAPGDPDAEFELAVDGQVLDRWRLRADAPNFLRFLDLPDGLPGIARNYTPLTIVAHTIGNGRRAVVAVRQFDVRPDGHLIWAFGDGWHEAESDVRSGRQWRWSSERSIVLVKGFVGDVRLGIRGESPLRYFDAPPTVRVVAGGREIARLRPDADFDWTVIIPADDLLRGSGAIALETDPVYLPGPAEGTSDARHLGLRVVDARVDPVTP
jgi:hypothetical protein